MDKVERLIKKRRYKSASATYKATLTGELLVSREMQMTLKYYKDMKIYIPQKEVECMKNIMRLVTNRVDKNIQTIVRAHESTMYVSVFHPTSSYNYIPDIVKIMQTSEIITENIYNEGDMYMGIYVVPYENGSLHRKIVID